MIGYLWINEMLALNKCSDLFNNLGTDTHMFVLEALELGWVLRHPDTQYQ